MDKAEIWQHRPGVWVAERGNGVYRETQVFGTWHEAMDWVARWLRFLQI